MTKLQINQIKILIRSVTHVIHIYYHAGIRIEQSLNQMETISCCQLLRRTNSIHMLEM